MAIWKFFCFWKPILVLIPSCQYVSIRNFKWKQVTMTILNRYQTYRFNTSNISTFCKIITHKRWLYKIYFLNDLLMLPWYSIFGWFNIFHEATAMFWLLLIHNFIFPPLVRLIYCKFPWCCSRYANYKLRWVAPKIIFTPCLKHVNCHSF